MSAPTPAQRRQAFARIGYFALGAALVAGVIAVSVIARAELSDIIRGQFGVAPWRALPALVVTL